MGKFTFNSEHHYYELDGVRLPSVTQIMKPLYDFSMVDKEVLRRAGEYGTSVHKMIELYLDDNLDIEALDPSLHNPLMAFQQWQEEEDFEFTGCENIECIGYHPKLKYAGTPDIETETVIIDIKTRLCDPVKDSIQLAAYDRMTGNGKREHRVLYLGHDGSYQYTKVNNSQAWARFRFLHQYYQDTQTIKGWDK